MNANPVEIKILTITTLYPNHIEPRLGIFIKTRLSQLKQRYPGIKHTVIAPVPWFPFKSDYFGKYSNFAKVNKTEIDADCLILHPKYLVIPKVGMILTPIFLGVAIWNQLRKLHDKGYMFDVIDGHYFYPDGVAIALANITSKIPFTITARGTDINIIPSYQIPRALIRWAAKKSAYCISVSSALGEKLKKIGAESNKVITIRNGVDLELFIPPNSKIEVREKLNIHSPMLVAVGYFYNHKGQHLIIQAIENIPHVHLYLIGDGPEKNHLKQLTEELNLSDRVHFLGTLSQQDLVKYFQAADISVLASSREGWANVLLESMACGTPVVATDIEGTAEVIKEDQAGLLVERNVESLKKGIIKLLQSDISIQETRKYAERFGWNDVSDMQFSLFKKLQKS